MYTSYFLYLSEVHTTQALHKGSEKYTATLQALQAYFSAPWKLLGNESIPYMWLATIVTD